MEETKEKDSSKRNSENEGKKKKEVSLSEIPMDNGDETRKPTSLVRMDSAITTTSDPHLAIVKVYLLDGSYKAIKLNPTQATVEDLWEIVSDKMLLTPQSCPCFFIYGQEGDLELLLYAHENLLDLSRDWNVFRNRYNKQEQTELIKRIASGGKKISKTISSKGFKTLGRSTITRSRSVEDQKVAEIQESEKFRLVFRTTTILPLAEEIKHRDIGSIHLFYTQAVYNVISSNFPCDAIVAIQLGGIQLQISAGDFNPQVHKKGYLQDSLSSYIPEHLRSKLKTESWEERLFLEHAKHKGRDNHYLKMMYLEIVRKWKYYGCTFFKAKLRPTQEAVFYKQDFEGKVRLGVNEFGIHIVDAKALRVTSYPYSSIQSWDSEKDLFWFEFRDERKPSFLTITKLMDVEKSNVYELITKQAELINDTLCDWQAFLGSQQRESKRKSKR